MQRLDLKELKQKDVRCNKEIITHHNPLVLLPHTQTHIGTHTPLPTPCTQEAADGDETDGDRLRMQKKRLWQVTSLNSLLCASCNFPVCLTVLYVFREMPTFGPCPLLTPACCNWWWQHNVPLLVTVRFCRAYVIASLCSDSGSIVKVQ